MKKLVSIALIFLFATTLLVAPAQAKSSKVILKGEVLRCDESDMKVFTTTGENVTVELPADFEDCKVETWVLVKGDPGDDDVVIADLVKVVGPKDKDGDGEAGKMNGAFCSEDKKALTEEHPIAEKIQEVYDVEKSWVMKYFCDGFGMGAIMLALKTNVDLDNKQEGAEDMLKLRRDDGMGWGQIWKEAKQNADDSGGKVPPGQQKKEDGSGAPPGQGPKNDK